jgi:flagellar motor switch protein FliN
MSTYFENWIRVAADLLHQALAGEPELVESPPDLTEAETFRPAGSLGFVISLAGDEAGIFSVWLDGSILETPLLGEGVEQTSSWAELLREIFEAACGELLAKTGKKCRVEKFEARSGAKDGESKLMRMFQLRSDERCWRLWVHDEVRAPEPETAEAKKLEQGAVRPEPVKAALSSGLELLLDVELEASLRFGCREMPLGEILELGPGDVVQLDRHVADPVDLIVGDKIVARGEVVLVDGNFGLRISEVAAPRMRLESIRCLF